MSRLSSWFARAALAAAVLAIAVLAVVLLLDRRSGDETDERRAAVSAYIVEVNTTQQVLIVKLEQASSAYRNLSFDGGGNRQQLERVQGVEVTLKTLRSRFSMLQPPAEAGKLHAELLRLVDLQIAFAQELAGMARFLPIQAGENRSLAAATERLRRALKRDATAREQQDAFQRYGDVVEAVAARLQAASAPPVLEPARTAEIARLDRLAGLAGQVVKALERQDADAIDRLSRMFVQVAGTTGSTRAERQAVIAFNRRLAAIGDQRTAVNAERNRVDVAVR